MAQKSRVWYQPADEVVDATGVIIDKLQRLLDGSGFGEIVATGDTAQVTMHFGEAGNCGYVRPALIRVVTGSITRCGGTAIVSDTNTLYRGRRMNSADHLALAREHGFTDEATGASVDIPDERDTAQVVALPVSGRYLKTAKVLRCYSDADLLVGVAHFKGHLVSGFGGAVKNIGMGCATREGKLAQHAAVAPFVLKANCIGCAACCGVCPADAIRLHEGIAVVNQRACIGCASCIAACKSDAMELDWGSGAGAMPEKMAEYAAAVLKACRKKFFINVALRITAECDCLAGDDPRIVPDIGLFASSDPVAIDQACYDFSCRKAGGFDPFRKAHPKRDPVGQLDYAEALGIGSRDYELLTL
jgi:uncharacterized Fe-S center protein